MSTDRFGFIKPMFALTPDGKLVLTGVPVPNIRQQIYEGERYRRKRSASFWRYSHLYNLMTFYLKNRRLPHITPAPLRPLRPEEHRQVRVAAAIYGAINQLAVSKGASLLVVFAFPDNDQRFVELSRSLDKQKIANAPLKRRVLPRNELWNDHHVNARGHGSMAGIISDWFEELPNQTEKHSH